MIDFIKIELAAVDRRIMDSTIDFDWMRIDNESTAEVGNYAFGVYKNLVFRRFERRNGSGVMYTMEGSLHKFANHGLHNYDDFLICQFYKQVARIGQELGFNIGDSAIRNLEFGVNIVPPIPTEEILNSILFHRTTPFKDVSVPKDGDYRQASHQRYMVKAYDKKRQYMRRYSLKDPILRYELKFTRMADLHQFGIFTVRDLTQSNQQILARVLAESWVNILYSDPVALKGHKKQEKYSNPNFWKSLNPEQFKYHRRRLNEIIAENTDNSRSKMSALILQKGLYLTGSTLK